MKWNLGEIEIGTLVMGPDGMIGEVEQVAWDIVFIRPLVPWGALMPVGVPRADVRIVMTPAEILSAAEQAALAGNGA